MSPYDIIIFHINNTNDYIRWVRGGGGVLMDTLDRMKIQPSQGQPFITSNYILSCFKIVLLIKSFHSSGNFYLEAQSIVQNDRIKFDRKTYIIT